MTRFISFVYIGHSFEASSGYGNKCSVCSNKCFSVDMDNIRQSVNIQYFWGLQGPIKLQHIIVLALLFIVILITLIEKKCPWYIIYQDTAYNWARNLSTHKLRQNNGKHCFLPLSITINTHVWMRVISYFFQWPCKTASIKSNRLWQFFPETLASKIIMWEVRIQISSRSIWCFFQKP